jgi:hypothetical protein
MHHSSLELMIKMVDLELDREELACYGYSSLSQASDVRLCGVLSVYNHASAHSLAALEKKKPCLNKKV